MIAPASSKAVRRCRHALRRAMLGALALSSQAVAQGVSGVVLEADSTTRAPYLAVVLHDSAGRIVTRGQTSAQGTFHLLLPVPGVYTLRALRVGYAPTVSPLFRVSGEASTTIRIVLSERRISLPLVTVRERARCATRGADGSALVEAWDQARTALYGVTTDQTDARPLLESVTYLTIHDVYPDSGRTSAVDPPRRSRGDAFRSPAAAELLRSGFVIATGDSVEYHAPDAYVLLDPAFAAGHCFWLEPGPTDHRDWIGIGVRPAANVRGVAGIQGVLWLRRDGALVRFDFHYVGLPPEFAEANAGGRVEFDRLPSGQWIVSRWSIRMPQGTSELRERERSAIRSTLARISRLGRVFERGGAVLSAEWPGGAVTLGSRVLELRVTTTGPPQPLRDTEVRLVSGGRVQRADTSGRAVFDSVSAGTHTVMVRTPLMRDAGYSAQPVSVAVLPDTGVMRATVMVPSVEDVRRALCPSSPSTATRAMALGSIAALARGAPTSVRLSRASAYDPATGDAGAMAIAVDSAGYWRACDVPRGTPMVLWTADSGARQVVTRFRVPENIDMAFVGTRSRQETAPLSSGQGIDASGTPRGARLTVRVVAALDSTPIVNAHVFVDDSLIARPDRTGRYRATGLPRGTYRLSARRLGLAPVERLVEVNADATEVQIAMDRLPTLLSDVVISGRRIVASSRYDDVLRRAASSTGDFFTRDDMRQAYDIRTLLASIPGVQAYGSGLTFQRCQASTPGERAKVQVYIDGVRVTSLAPMRVDIPGRGRREPLAFNTDDVVMEAIRSVNPADIEFIEVYRGVARIPAEFLDDACAVIAIWTRAY